MITIKMQKIGGGPQAQGFYDIFQAEILNWQRFSENICVKVEQRRSKVSSNTECIFFSSLPPPFSHASPKFFVSLLSILIWKYSIYPFLIATTEGFNYL